MQAAPDLQGRVVLVTGSARRTGRMIAHKFAEAGASLVINARSAAAEAEAVAKEIEAKHGKGRAFAHVADVCDAAAVDAMIARTVATYGRLDVLVNNAGIAGPNMPLADYPLDAWHDIININLNVILRKSIKA